MKYARTCTILLTVLALTGGSGLSFSQADNTMMGREDPSGRPIKKKTRIVISCDGGGVRGIIPAMVLEYLENELKFHLTEVVDVFAGSSTGGLIALGITAPDENGNPAYDMKDLVNLYETKGDVIFNEKDKKYSLKGYLRALYPLKGIRTVLESYFGDALLSNTLKEVFITSYDLDNAQPYFFTTTAAKKSKSHEFKIKDLAESTARAQGFLEFEAIKNAKDQTFNLIDGGNVENNPAELAYYHARNLYPHDNIIVISISTGDLRSSINVQKMYGGGLAEWVVPTISLQMGVHSLLVDWRMNQLLSDDLKADQFYVRIDKHLTDADADLAFTNVSEENIHKIKKVGREVVAGYKDVLDTLVARLKQVKAERDTASRNWKKAKGIGVAKKISEIFSQEGKVRLKKNQELIRSFQSGPYSSDLYRGAYIPKRKIQPAKPTEAPKDSKDLD